jgi:N-carbamoylputrescine amidase
MFIKNGEMEQSRMVKTGLVQMQCVPDKKENVQKALKMIAEAADQGAQIVCLQELCHMIYFCYEENYDHFLLAESLEGGMLDEFSALARKKRIVLIVPYFEKRTEGIYHNSAFVVDADGSLLGNYRKNHIPDDPGYYEKFYFTPGDTGYMSFQTRYARIGILICWDQWYPEASRITSLMGAEILFYPTAIGWEEHEDTDTRKEQQEAWICMQRSHAIANGIYVAAVNRVGREKLTRFWGHSFICSPSGKIIASAGEEEEVVIVQELDLGKINNQRTHWPFFRDRRVDTYHSIEKRWID